MAARWGKVPVHARSTPGFIVNRIARPYYAETLALLQQLCAATPDGVVAFFPSYSYMEMIVAAWHTMGVLRAVEAHKWRRWRYRFDQMNGLLGFLTAHCCEGQPCDVTTAVACDHC